MSSDPNRQCASAVDLFSDEVLADPYPTYSLLRDQGPAAYLEREDIWFLGRYRQVRDALLDWRSFSSAGGVGLNPVINQAWADAEICQDPPQHTPLRKLFTDRLGPRQLRPLEQTIDQRADQLVQRLLDEVSFDGVADLAHELPVNVIMDLIGWPESGRTQLLALAAGSFDSCGPANERAVAALPLLSRTMEYVTEVFDARSLTEATFGHTISQAADRGEISRDVAVGLLSGYVVAAFDTTINAIASGLWLFAEHPDQWNQVHEDPSSVPAALNEILRLESPIQHLARVATKDIELGDGVVIPNGARVLVSYAAGNRDEGQYGADAGSFRVRRSPTDQLAFGAGVHSCAGQSLARLEAHAIFRALALRVRRIEVADEPTRAINNVTRGFSRLPIRIG